MSFFFVESLGCPKNLVDTEQVVARLMESGYKMTLSEEDADILLLNTCSFIESARAESLSEIERLLVYKKQNKRLFILGCLPQMWQDKLLKMYPQLDGIMGVNNVSEGIEKLLAGVREYTSSELPGKEISDSRALLTAGHSAYLKIAEGCDHKCAFCTIPAIRGSFRSRPVDQIIEEAEALVASGVQELSLIAQDSTSYGYDLAEKSSLAELLKELDQFDVWIRVMYMYPTSINAELLKVIKESKNILPYFDIPFQHISKNVLKEMRRSPVDIRKLIKEIKSIEGASIRATFIVGYPGETLQNFDELVEFIRDFQLDRVAVFCYSPEKGTGAAELKNQIAEDEKERRMNIIYDVQSKVDEKNKQLINKEITVLFDSDISGRTYRDAPEVDGDVVLLKGSTQVGTIQKVRVTEARGYNLKGVLI